MLWIKLCHLYLFSLRFLIYLVDFIWTVKVQTYIVIRVVRVVRNAAVKYVFVFSIWFVKIACYIHFVWIVT